MEQLFLPNLYTWTKDSKSKYLDCNENIARIAGLDSIHQINGKTDSCLPWKIKSEFITGIDSLVCNNLKTYINSVEIFNTANGIITLLVTKNPLLNKNGKCVGTAGYGVDITGYTLSKDISYVNSFSKKFHLGEKFNNEYLTRRETEVFNYILLGYSAKKIANYLNLSIRTIEGYIDILKHKLMCNSKNDIISVAAKHGLTYILNIK